MLRCPMQHWVLWKERPNFEQHAYMSWASPGMKHQALASCKDQIIEEKDNSQRLCSVEPRLDTMLLMLASKNAALVSQRRSDWHAMFSRSNMGKTNKTIASVSHQSRVGHMGTYLFFSYIDTPRASRTSTTGQKRKEVQYRKHSRLHLGQVPFWRTLQRQGVRIWKRECGDGIPQHSLSFYVTK